MLRLALLATAISLANAASGTGYVLYQMKDIGSSATTWAEDKVTCAHGGEAASTGTAAAGPSFTAEITGNGVFQNKVFIVDECYNLSAASYLPMGIYTAVGAQHSIISADSGSALVLSVKLTKGTNDVPELETYAAVDCATETTDSPQGPTDGAAGSNLVGFQCTAAVGSLTTGYAVLDNSAANDYVNAKVGFKTLNYLKLDQYSDARATSPAVQTCATAVTTNVGVEKFYLHVMADEVAAHVATINTWKLRESIGCYVESHANFNGGTGTKSYQTVCDKETGDIVYNHYNAADNCSAGTDVQLRFNNNVGCTESASGVNWKFATGTTFRAMCASPASTATAKWFTGYLSDDATNCAALDNTGTITASHVEGTKAVIIGVCYTGQHANGQLAGFAGPFSAGTAATEPISITPRTGGTNPTGDNAGGSFKFTEETSGNIGLMQYASPDCSETTATTATFVTDNPAGAATTDWPCDAVSSNFLTHGGVGTSGNASAQLQTASNYLTVRAHGDQTAGDHNMGGKCHGVINPASGRRVDHFILDQCMQSGVATSYKFKCESGGTVFTNATDGDYYAISYDEYATAACTGTPTAAKFLYFTQTSFDSAAITATGLAATAALSDTAAEWALNEMNCGSCAGTAANQATCEALTSSNTWTAGTCTDAHGAADEWGGKCLQRGSDAADGATWNSWEIMTDNATWNAMCGVATPAPATTTTTTSGAGKIAATAAAAAAAAALLL